MMLSYVLQDNGYKVTACWARAASVYWGKGRAPTEVWTPYLQVARVGGHSTSHRSAQPPARVSGARTGWWL